MGVMTENAAATSSGSRGRRRLRAAAVTWGLCLVLGACTSAADTGAGAPPAAGSGSAAPTAGSATPGADALIVTITEADGKVTPNGKKLDARVGQQVVLDVTSDRDDEIHAHIGGDGYELEVKAGQRATGTFTLDSAGSFEVESHHLEKVIVILNAR